MTVLYTKLNRDTLKVESCNNLELTDSKLKKDFVGNYCVSTICLSIDHWGFLFETLVFPYNEEEITDWAEVDGRRTRTYAEAIKRHEEFCILYRCL